MMTFWQRGVQSRCAAAARLERPHKIIKLKYYDDVRFSPTQSKNELQVHWAYFLSVLFITITKLKSFLHYI